MALENQIETESGVTASYWDIQNIAINILPTSVIVEVKVNLFLDESKRLLGKSGIISKTVNFKLPKNTQINDFIASIETQVKNKDSFFKDAKTAQTIH